MSEIARELSVAMEQRRLLEDLATNQGFLLLSSLMQQQADALQQEILFTPCAGLDSAIAAEYKKGELAGRLAWEHLRKTYISSLEITINHLRSKIDDEPDDRSPDANSAP